MKKHISRLMLEAYSSKYAPFFVTLTYDDEHLPADVAYPYKGNLSRDDLKKFIDRLVKNYKNKYNIKDYKLRFFAVGEYGSRTKRAHYHLIIFHDDASRPIDILIPKSWTLSNPNLITIDQIGLKSSTLNLSNSSSGTDFAKSFRYVSKYILKSKTTDYPLGLQPEFASYSRNPVLGFGFLKNFYTFSLKRFGAPAVPLIGLSLEENYLYHTYFDAVNENQNYYTWNGVYFLDDGGRFIFPPTEHMLSLRDKNNRCKYGTLYNLDKTLARNYIKTYVPELISTLQFIKDTHYNSSKLLEELKNEISLHSGSLASIENLNKIFLTYPSKSQPSITIETHKLRFYAKLKRLEANNSRTSRL